MERRQEAEQSFVALNEQLAHVHQNEKDCSPATNLGKYSFAGQLTRELPEALVKEIRVIGNVKIKTRRMITNRDRQTPCRDAGCFLLLLFTANQCEVFFVSAAQRKSQKTRG